MLSLHPFSSTQMTWSIGYHRCPSSRDSALPFIPLSPTLMSTGNSHLGHSRQTPPFQTFAGLSSKVLALTWKRFFLVSRPLFSQSSKFYSLTRPLFIFL